MSKRESYMKFGIQKWSSSYVLLSKLRVGPVIIVAHTHCHRSAGPPCWHEAAAGLRVSPASSGHPQLLWLLPDLSASPALGPGVRFALWWRCQLSPTDHLYYQSWKLGGNEKTMQAVVPLCMSQHILAGSRLSFVFLISSPCFLPICLFCWD